MITNTITEKQAEYISSLMSAKLAVAEIGDDAFVAQQRNAQNKSREWVRIIFSAMPASMDMSKEEASEVIEFLNGFPSDIRRLAFEIRRVKITESVARFAGERALAMMDALATSIETKSHRGRYEHLMTVQEIWAAILTDWIAENPETQPNPDNDPTPTASTATENTLDAVMTASEIAVEFDTSERNVRMAAERGAVKARQSGKTWLILRRDAERMWNTRKRIRFQSLTFWDMSTLAPEDANVFVAIGKLKHDEMNTYEYRGLSNDDYYEARDKKVIDQTLPSGKRIIIDFTEQDAYIEIR